MRRKPVKKRKKIRIIFINPLKIVTALKIFMIYYIRYSRSAIGFFDLSC